MLEHWLQDYPYLGQQVQQCTQTTRFILIYYLTVHIHKLTGNKSSADSHVLDHISLSLWATFEQ